MGGRIVEYIVILLMILVPMVLVTFADFLERVLYPLDRDE
jgi:hypothetical protein